MIIYFSKRKYSIGDKITIDPVCGKEVDTEVADSRRYKGKTYYFCTPACQWTFEIKPELFIKEG